MIALGLTYLSRLLLPSHILFQVVGDGEISSLYRFSSILFFNCIYRLACIGMAKRGKEKEYEKERERERDKSGEAIFSFLLGYCMGHIV